MQKQYSLVRCPVPFTQQCSVISAWRSDNPSIASVCGCVSKASRCWNDSSVCTWGCDGTFFFVCNLSYGQFIYISKRLTCSPNTSITCTCRYTETHTASGKGSRDSHLHGNIPNGVAQRCHTQNENVWGSHEDWHYLMVHICSKSDT